MLLLDYLNDNFQCGGTWTDSGIVKHFMEQFGVNVKIEDDLYLFKYGQLEAKWVHDITHECRGPIVRKTKNGWKLCSYPFDKFFNQQEGHCPIWKEKDFNDAISDLSFVEKCDGTCIQLWYDDVLGKWRVSTLGSITTTNVHDSTQTFEELFWKIFGDNSDALVKDYVYLFELCSVLNRVVTRYSSDRLYLLGVRDMNRLELLEYDMVYTIGHVLGVMIPIRHSFFDLGLTTLEQANDWIEAESGKIELYGEYPEGFVVYNDKGPICKMKNSGYLALHHSLSDAACTRKAVVAAFFKGTMDDLYAALPEEFQGFADKLRDWASEIHVHFSNVVAPTFRSQKFNSRKDYALYVQGLPEPESKFRPFFFQHQEEICESDNDLGAFFLSWLKKNYEKYMDDWKNMHD
jgi:hypothetical protein